MLAGVEWILSCLSCTHLQNSSTDIVPSSSTSICGQGEHQVVCMVEVVGMGSSATKVCMVADACRACHGMHSTTVKQNLFADDLHMT